MNNKKYENEITIEGNLYVSLQEAEKLTRLKSSTWKLWVEKNWVPNKRIKKKDIGGQPKIYILKSFVEEIGPVYKLKEAEVIIKGKTNKYFHRNYFYKMHNDKTNKFMLRIFPGENRKKSYYVPSTSLKNFLETCNHDYFDIQKENEIKMNNFKKRERRKNIKIKTKEKLEKKIEISVTKKDNPLYEIFTEKGVEKITELFGQCQKNFKDFVYFLNEINSVENIFDWNDLLDKKQIRKYYLQFVYSERLKDKKELKNQIEI